jgi:hypothetical protein
MCASIFNVTPAVGFIPRLKSWAFASNHCNSVPTPGFSEDPTSDGILYVPAETPISFHESRVYGRLPRTGGPDEFDVAHALTGI